MTCERVNVYMKDGTSYMGKRLTIDGLFHPHARAIRFIDDDNAIVYMPFEDVLKVCKYWTEEE